MNLDRRLLRYIGQGRLYLFIAIALGFGGVLLAIWQAKLISGTIAQVFLENASIMQVGKYLALLLVVILGRAFTFWGIEVSTGRLALRVKRFLRKQIYEEMMISGPLYVRGEQTGELVEVVTQGVEELDAYYSQYLPQLALAVLVPLTLLVFITPVDLLSAVVLLVTAPLIPFFLSLTGSMAQALTSRQWEALSRLNAYFLDIIQGLPTLKMLGRSREQASQVVRFSQDYRRITMKVLRVTFLSALVLELLSTLSTAVVAVQVGLRLLYGWVEFEQALFVLMLAPEFYLPLRMLGTRFHAGMSGVAAGKRIFQALEHMKDMQSVERKAGLVQTPAWAEWSALGKNIKLKNVSFCYPGGMQALSNVNLIIPAGKTTALVGLSGAGKSTLADLLLRFSHPADGEIQVDEFLLGDIPMETWRDQVAWLPQDPFLFHDTLEANIKLGRPDASYKQMTQAARRARIDTYIQSLPQGYQTVIGERGARLSAGQAQRIALARAFLKNAPILILDESAAHLDPQTEQELQCALDELSVGRTVILICHRLHSAINADQVIVLEQGKVVESGAPMELMEKDGVFAHMRTGSRLEFLVQPGLLPVEMLPKTPVLLSNKLVDSSDELTDVSMSTGWRLLHLTLPYWRWMLLASVLGIAAVSSSVGLMAASAYIISAAALRPSIAALQVAIVGVRFFGIARGVFRYLERYVSHEATFRILAGFRSWSYRALEPLTPARLLRYRSGDLLSRITGDIAALEGFYVRALAPPVTAIGVVVITAVVLYAYHPDLVFVYLGLVVFSSGLITWLARQLGKRAGVVLRVSRAALSATLVDGVQGMADLLAFGQTERQASRIAQFSKDLENAQLRMVNINGLQAMLSGFFANLSLWVLLMSSIPLIRSGELAGVFLATVALASLTSYEALVNLPIAAQYLENHLQAAGRLFELADQPIAVRESDQPKPAPEKFDLEVRGLSFRYPATGENQPETLQQVSFSFPQGKRLAIVGASGSGKTTLLNLVLRFWEWDRGEISLNGKSLRVFDSEAIRRRIAVLPQNPYLFSASLRENLLIARPGANEGQLWQACQEAQIASLVESMPQGLDTWLGEQGKRLSGGERQRVALARAMLQDSAVLALDEPTANLDAVTEAAVIGSLQQAAAGRSILLITHRLVGMPFMDEILVFKDGMVLERGNHADLLAQNGLYSHMWETVHSE